MLIIGTHLWEELTDQERSWLKQAVENSVKYQRTLWAEAEAYALEQVQKEGVEIIRPDKTLFSQQVGEIYDQYKGDEAMYSIIKQIQETN